MEIRNNVLIYVYEDDIRDGTLSVPNGVTAIGEMVLRYVKGVHTVKLPESVTQICDYAFYRYHTLSSLDINQGVQSIGAYAFSQTNLTKLCLPNSITELGEGAFQQCKNLTMAKLSEGILHIPDRCFQSSGLSDVFFGKDLQSIGAYAFANCPNLQPLTLQPNTDMEIGRFAFAWNE